ncbi:MAG: Hsp70 family protein [Pirellulaceae bacterium]
MNTRRNVTARNVATPNATASNVADRVPDGFEEKLSRFIVGIDLGTTNSAVAFVDTQRPLAGIENFYVEQWVDFGVSERRSLLPSFYYQPLPEEVELLRGDIVPPRGEGEPVVGALARDRGLQLPGRQIASAKSWLCHGGVDRQSPILPWQNDEGVEKQSPVQASAQYLIRMRQAWDKAHARDPLAEQDIVLTLPASFDQVARQLTIEAAKLAGLPRVLLIEEPQAAFYAWLARHGDQWEDKVQPGQTILVCDIGGGTTDFTLIRVRQTGAIVASPTAAESAANSSGGAELNSLHRQRLSLHRVAVGQHLILGGDNIDLALAKYAEQKLTGGKSLAPRAWDALRQACRVAKETLLGASPPAAYTIHLPGGGSRLIGGGNQVEITNAEVQAVVLDGFFPSCSLRDRAFSEQTGFQEFGLPYAADARITRHLASFLWEHRHAGRTDVESAEPDEQRLARPDWILFNGGVMTSSLLTERLLDVISSWFSTDKSEWRPGVLDGEQLDLAVACGAAYFGNVRRGGGVEIEAKLACSYYLQTSQDPPEAICIVPGSASPGDAFSMSDMPLELAVGKPVQFPIAYSTTRLADRVGQRVAMDPEHFVDLPPIRTVLSLSGTKRQENLPVVIDIELSQIGTLQMWCQSTTTAHRWKLEFDVRGGTQTDVEVRESTANRAGILDEQMKQTARQVLERVFGPAPDLPPSKLMQELSAALELSRSAWTPDLLRGMWQTLIDLDDGRKQSAAHEARWLNLLGYSLRPGYGMAADDWRVAQSWRTVHGSLSFATPSSKNESLILWRRIAGGFTAGQQLTIYQQIAGPLRNVLDPVRRPRGGQAQARTN